MHELGGGCRHCVDQLYLCVCVRVCVCVGVCVCVRVCVCVCVYYSIYIHICILQLALYLPQKHE